MQELNEVIGIKLLTSVVFRNFWFLVQISRGENARFAPLRTPMLAGVIPTPFDVAAEGQSSLTGEILR